MKKLILTITAAAGLCALTAFGQSVSPTTWGLTYTNVGTATATVSNETTNTSVQAVIDFTASYSGRPVVLLASCYSTNVVATNTADGTAASFVFTPSPDGVTFYSDDYNTNNRRLAISMVNSNTSYAWRVFDPGQFRYWRLSAFEKPSTNMLATNITLKVYRWK